MNYNSKGTGLAITPELREYLERKLAHVEKFLGGDTATRFDVELEYRAGERGKKYRTEFTVLHRGAVYRANERGDTMHEAIDKAEAQLSGELSRTKKKRLDFVRAGAGKAKEFLRGLRGRI